MMKEEYLKYMKEQFAEAFGEHIVDVNLDYHSYLRLVQNHLDTLFGVRADWKNNLAKYRASEMYKNQCHIAMKLEDIPEITFDDINKQIKEEEEYNQLVDRVMILYDTFLTPEKCSDQDYCTAMIEVENLMGLNPFYHGSTINNWMVDFENFGEDDIKRYHKGKSEGALTNIITKVLCNEYTPGIIMSYPGTELTMIQRKSKNFYRGENAYYVKSQPSAYRHTDWKLDDVLQQVVDDLRCFEAAYMFLKLDVVKNWGYSTPNYRALGQHYGLWTNMMDITSSLKTALFFACCKYVDGKWLPLNKDDFEHKDSRRHIAKLGGDSRYGIIFTCPTEINTMSHGIAKADQVFNMVHPVGFQPFMRCAAQSAYGMPINNRSYNLFYDEKFSKVKIRLTEELCNWIYHEMAEGDLIYPRKDVPDIGKQINEINSTKHFSKCAFEDLIKHAEFNEGYAEEIREKLKVCGYHILDFDKTYFTGKQLIKLNKTYTLDRAQSLVQEKPMALPMMILC